MPAIRSGGIHSAQSDATMEVCEMDPNPDYDATDEIEYFFSWFPWALRGTDWTGTPAYPPV